MKPGEFVRTQVGRCIAVERGFIQTRIAIILSVSGLGEDDICALCPLSPTSLRDVCKHFVCRETVLMRVTREEVQDSPSAKAIGKGWYSLYITYKARSFLEKIHFENRVGDDVPEGDRYKDYVVKGAESGRFSGGFRIEEPQKRENAQKPRLHARYKKYYEKNKEANRNKDKR